MNALLVIFLISYGVYSLFNNFKFWLIYLSLIAIYYYFTQVKFFQSAYNSLRRKICIATWETPFDPQIYTKVKLDITRVEPYLETISKETGEKVTLTVYVIKLMSILLKKFPELYGYIKFGKFLNKEGVDICCVVGSEDEKVLMETTITNAERKDFKEINKDLNNSVDNTSNKQNKQHNKNISAFSLLPTL